MSENDEGKDIVYSLMFPKTDPLYSEWKIKKDRLDSLVKSYEKFPDLRLVPLILDDVNILLSTFDNVIKDVIHKNALIKQEDYNKRMKKEISEKKKLKKEGVSKE